MAAKSPLAIRAQVQRIARKFEKRRAKVARTGGAMGKIGTLVFQNIQKRFRRGSLFWKPLAASTKKEKARLKFSQEPLIRTGFLRQAWDIRVRRNSVKVQSKASYSSFHQRGTKHIPARPMLDEDVARKAAKRVLGAHVRASIK